DEKGIEPGHSKVNMILFDDVHQLFGAPVGSFINTDMSQPLRDYKVITFSLSFTSPQSSVAVTAPPYNPYLIVGSGSGSRDREVHLPGYPPTVKANPAYFGMGQDVTNPGLNRYYIALNNMPYAIHTPVLFSYPIEKAAIGNAHAKFSPWSTSFGVQFANWYLNNQGYRNSGLIYNKEPVGPVVRPRAKTNVK
ncbi:MAG: LruC domain-containing protein, partial [Bacteroidales bacterium]